MRGTERPVQLEQKKGGKVWLEEVGRGKTGKSSVPTYCIRIDCLYPQSNRKTLCFKQRAHMSRFTCEKIIMAIE